MSWRGIPYSFPSAEITEKLSVALSSLPNIKLESEPDYTLAFITFAASLLPAFVAIWTVMRNANHMKKQLEHQQAFMREEREKQEIFLRDERADQQKVTEKDRDAQVAIAKQNFNMQVLSVNRQNWINELRNLVSDYAAKGRILFEVSNDALSARIDLKIALKLRTETPKHSDPVDYKEKLERFRSANNEKKSSENDVNVLLYKANLMLNPTEDISREIIGSMEKILFFAMSRENSPGDNFIILNKNIDELLQHTQCCLKTEWVRVKAGK